MPISSKFPPISPAASAGSLRVTWSGGISPIPKKTWIVQSKDEVTWPDLMDLLVNLVNLVRLNSASFERNHIKIIKGKPLIGLNNFNTPKETLECTVYSFWGRLGKLEMNIIRGRWKIFEQAPFLVRKTILTGNMCAGQSWTPSTNRLPHFWVCLKIVHHCPFKHGHTGPYLDANKSSIYWSMLRLVSTFFKRFKRVFILHTARTQYTQSFGASNAHQGALSSGALRCSQA